MLYCSSECGSISIMQLRTIYCNTHVHTFHVCLCLLKLTFVCNSTYLLKCSFQIYQKSIVVFIRSSKVWFKTTSCAKGPVTRCNFLGNLQRNSALKRCKLVFVEKRSASETWPICSCLPSLSLYFNIIYFASADATMFQNIQQSHSGGSNTNLSWFQSGRKRIRKLRPFWGTWQVVANSLFRGHSGGTFFREV